MPGVDERGVDARRDLDLLAVVERLELGERRLGVLGRVQRRIEVDVELRRLGAQVGLGVARPRPAAPGAGSTVVGTCSPVGRRAGVASTASGAPRPRAASSSRRLRPARGPPGTASACLRSSASTSSGWRFSQRASRLANSSWSLPESSRTSVASSTVPAVAWIGPR